MSCCIYLSQILVRRMYSPSPGLCPDLGSSPAEWSWLAWPYKSGEELEDVTRKYVVEWDWSWARCLHWYLYIATHGCSKIHLVWYIACAIVYLSLLTNCMDSKSDHAHALGEILCNKTSKQVKDIWWHWGQCKSAVVSFVDSKCIGRQLFGTLKSVDVLCVDSRGLSYYVPVHYWSFTS